LFNLSISTDYAIPWFIGPWQDVHVWFNCKYHDVWNFQHLQNGRQQTL